MYNAFFYEKFLGKNFVSNVKNKVYAQVFQQRHSRGKNTFIRNRKLSFPIVFSTILQLVKRSLGIECELMEPLTSKIPPSSKLFLKQGTNLLILALKNYWKTASE